MISNVRSYYQSIPYHLVSEFRKHLEETGSPHTWDGLSQEEVGIELIAIDRFQIPKRFIGSVNNKEGFGHCAICSPDKPKYVEGYLVYCSETSAVHVVGHECAASVIGAENFRLQIKAIDEQDKARSIDDFLEQHWHLPNQILEYAGQLRPQVRKADKIITTIQNAIRKPRANRIAQMLSDSGGYLMRAVDSSDAEDGESASHRGMELYSDQQLYGRDYLKSGRSNSMEGAILGVYSLLERFQFSSKDEMVAHLCEASDKDARDLKHYLEDSLTNLNGIRARLSGLERFLSPPNLLLLSRWLRDEGGLPPIEFEFSENGDINVFNGGTRDRRIPNPSDVWTGLPSGPSI